MRGAFLALAGIVAIAGAAAFDCRGGEPEPEPIPPAVVTVTSSAFADGQRIPTKYTCDGDDTSPPLAWSGAPAGTVTFAVIVSDPDAPHRTFIHGIVFDLPASVTSLAEGAFVPEGAIGGSNDFRTIGYGGPCPPDDDDPHHYEFRVYALDTALALEGEVLFLAFEEAIEGHVLSMGMLMGTYGR